VDPLSFEDEMFLAFHDEFLINYSLDALISISKE
jgi:hypothetical protein